MCWCAFVCAEKINWKAHTFLSHFFWSCRNTMVRGNKIFWVMEMLCHGISNQALGRGWSTESPLTARQTVVEGLSGLSHFCCLPLRVIPSGIRVCTFLTSFPRILHTSTQPPKHLLSTQAGRHVSSIIMHGTTQNALMAVGQLLMVHGFHCCCWVFVCFLFVCFFVQAFPTYKT